MTKNENIQTMNKEIVLYGDSDKEIWKETKDSGDYQKECISFGFMRNKKKKEEKKLNKMTFDVPKEGFKRKNIEPQSSKHSSDMMLFYDNFLSSSKNTQNKTINSARKLTSEEFRAKCNIKNSKKQHSVSVCFGIETKDLLKPAYIHTQTENIYKDKFSNLKSYSDKKKYKNSLRRKMLKSGNMSKSRIYSNDNTSMKVLTIDSSINSFRREKPVCSSIQKISTWVPSRSVVLNWGSKSSKFSKYPLTRTGKKNAQQVAKAIKRLSDLD